MKEPTFQQKNFLWSRNIETEGMTSGDAWKLISQIKEEEEKNGGRKLKSYEGFGNQI